MQLNDKGKEVEREKADAGQSLGKKGNCSFLSSYYRVKIAYNEHRYFTYTLLNASSRSTCISDEFFRVLSDAKTFRVVLSFQAVDAIGNDNSSEKRIRALFNSICSIPINVAGS